MTNSKINGASSNDAQVIEAQKEFMVLIAQAKEDLHIPSFDHKRLEVNEDYYRNLNNLIRVVKDLKVNKEENKPLYDLWIEFVNDLTLTRIDWYELVIKRYENFVNMFKDDVISEESKKDVYEYAYNTFDDDILEPIFTDFLISPDGHIYGYETACEKMKYDFKEVKKDEFMESYHEAKSSLDAKLMGRDENDDFDTREAKEKQFFIDLEPKEKLAYLAKKLWIEPIVPKDSDFISYIPHENVIKRIVNILSGPKGENNCMVLGASGAGKTAMVNFMINLVRQGVYQELIGKQFFKLNACNIEQRHIGETGESMMKLFKTFEENPDCILVIDEFAEFANNGGYQYDLTNNFGSKILPALSEGKIQVIGMENTSSYNLYILNDHALARRFKEVTVVEMKDDEAIELTQRMLSSYEANHDVKFVKKNLLAKRILNYSNKFYPGKANPAAISSIVHDLLANVNTFMHQASKTFDLESLNDFVKDKFNFNVNHSTLNYLSKTLKSLIIGQDNAINHLVENLTEYMYEFESGKRPVSLFLVGPTGVGKTESAKQLAKTCFKNESAMYKVNMGDYTNPALAPLLFNYLYPLAKFIKSHPCGVIVFDEIEKASEEVLKVLLAALDEGVANDGRGNILSLRGSVIIFTSNLGCNDSNKNVGSLIMSNPSGEDMDLEKIKEALKDYFKPEFIGRIDHFITFKALSKDNVLDILKLRLKELQASNSHYASLKIKDQELESLIDQANVKETGARSIPNVLKRYLLSKLNKKAHSAKETR